MTQRERRGPLVVHGVGCDVGGACRANGNDVSTERASLLFASEGRCPTEKQYGTLRNLAGGAAGLSWGKRHTEMFLRRGWVTAEWRPPYYQWVRITPDGLRALARAVEKFGLPEMGKTAQRERRACSDCGNDWNPRCECGSRTWHYDIQEIEVDMEEIAA